MRRTTPSRRRSSAHCVPIPRSSTAATCAPTIARNVATDFHRRERVTSADVPDLESVDEPLPYEELRRLTAELPQKERAAVFLRFGYDLSYEDIGNALGSSSEAARQAASSGVRRLRRKELS